MEYVQMTMWKIGTKNAGKKTNYEIKMKTNFLTD
jgi:hypothetical protein